MGSVHASIPATKMSTGLSSLCDDCAEFFSHSQSGWVQPGWPDRHGGRFTRHPTTCPICAYICTYVHNHVPESSIYTTFYCFEARYATALPSNRYAYHLLIEIRVEGEDYHSPRRITLPLVPLDSEILPRHVPRQG